MIKKIVAYKFNSNLTLSKFTLNFCISDNLLSVCEEARKKEEGEEQSVQF